MYYVQGDGNLLGRIENLLKQYFGDKAEIRGWSDGKLYVKVKPDAGFKDQENLPEVPADTPEEDIPCGGGIILGLDGKIFTVEVKEIQQYPWEK